MKRIFIFVLLSFAANSVAAQDIITKTNAEEVRAKVVKIGTDEIEYKSWDNLDGPVYVIRKYDVFSIKYQNGTRDIITSLGEIERRKKIYERLIEYPKYQGEIAVGYDLGMNSYGIETRDRVVFETTHGVRILPYLYTGLGVACNYYYPKILRLIYDDHYEDFVDEGVVIMPVYVNVKGYYPVARIADVYLSFDAGVAIGISSNAGGYKHFYTSVGPGINLGSKNGSPRCDLSVRYQYMGIFTDAILFRVGIQF
ncbi:MAG: hypothetical protein J1F10_05235 [Muribaculaceae bacterium]|nr:hypothetical protein [Muribaculaceae bacterium]